MGDRFNFVLGTNMCITPN